MKTTPNKIISTYLEQQEKVLQLLYHGEIDPKRKVHTLKWTMTLTDYQSQFIYTHLYLEAPIQVPFVRIWWNPGLVQNILVAFHWNPAE